MDDLKDFPDTIEFEWDKGNLLHIKKHKVKSTECEEVFFNEPITFLDVLHSKLKENRYIAIGYTNSTKFLYIVFIIKEKKIRVISARKAEKREELDFINERR